MSFIPKEIKPYEVKIIKGPFKGEKGTATCKYDDGVLGILCPGKKRAFAKEDEVLQVPDWAGDWAKDSIFEAVEDYVEHLSNAEFKQIFESYMPDKETVEDHPHLAEIDAAREHAVHAGFADNMASSLDEGITMLTTLLADASLKLEEWEDLACVPCRIAMNPDSVT